MKNIIYLLFVSVLFTACSSKTIIQDTIPNHDSLKIESTHVKETRIINVWTPPGYNDSNGAYPVLYMPDGGIKEDFPHIANTLAKLIDAKSIPPFILVGIENTVRARDLSGFSELEKDAQYCPLTDGAKNFRAFIADELFTDINNRYRTTNKKGIVGESLAGLFVVETFLLKPNTFDFYIAMDPSLWWNGNQLVNTAKFHLSNFPTSSKKLWFAGSSAKDIAPHTNNLAAQLESQSPKTLTWKYSDEPSEKHNTIFRATKEKAFIWTMNSK